MVKKNVVFSAEVDSNGEIRIPVGMLKSLGFEPGEPMIFIDTINGVEIVKPALKKESRAASGNFRVIKNCSNIIM